MKVISVFKTEYKATLNMWGKFTEVDNTPSREILGIDFIEPK